MKNQSTVPPLRVSRRLNTSDIEAITRKTRQTIWRWIKADKFPKPQYINGQRSWTEEVILEWQDGLQSFEERDSKNIDVLTGRPR